MLIFICDFSIFPSGFTTREISMVYWGNQQSKVILNLLSACDGATLFSYSFPKTMTVNDSAVILVPSLSIGDLELYSWLRAQICHFLGAVGEILVQRGSLDANRLRLHKLTLRPFFVCRFQQHKKIIKSTKAVNLKYELN